LSRTLPPRLVLVVMALATLLGLLAMTAAGRPALAQPTTTRGTPGANQPTTTVTPTTAAPTSAPTTSAPTTTAAPSTAAPTTSAPATSAPTSSEPSTSEPATGAPATGPAGVGPGPTGPTNPSGPGAPAQGGPGATGTAGPGGGTSAATGGGARGVVEELVRGHPVEAARRAVESAVRELGDLSPVELVLFGLLALFALVLTAIAVTSLWWMLHAWRTPASLLATGFPTSDTAPQHAFSLIVPARHEQAVLGATLERLAGSHHPRFEVLAVVGDDDPETRAVAEQAAARHPDRIRVLVDASQPKNKPKALNTACRPVPGRSPRCSTPRTRSTPSFCGTWTPALSTPAPTSFRAGSS
jgi:hypothetical protein